MIDGANPRPRRNNPRPNRGLALLERLELTQPVKGLPRRTKSPARLEQVDPGGDPIKVREALGQARRYGGRLMAAVEELTASLTRAARGKLIPYEAGQAMSIRLNQPRRAATASVYASVVKSPDSIPSSPSTPRTTPSAASTSSGSAIVSSSMNV